MRRTRLNLKNKTCILSTKRLFSHQKQLLLDANFEVIESDFIQIEFKPFELKSTTDFLIFTSQNAVKSVVQNQKFIFLKTIKCFCVGQKTKELLEEKGFEVLHFSEYAEELAAYILAHYSKSSFTFFSGNLRRDTLPEAMSKANIVFTEIEVYQTILKPQKINLKTDGILFFSPSAIESYLMDNGITNEICFCIGTTTAEGLKHRTQNIQIAPQPIVDSVIKLAISLMK